ncbi:maternal effect protein staufen isoform X2 [Anopheles aquasalis]|uniref:maternal effect protein staufen isoform X2 n=1 Tax=Anopheles aquasalis TaxID=42839 RepID=UPI00215A7A56|nr:maternal effect protein staufen isoform X2 [Anopheles aquasalis]
MHGHMPQQHHGMHPAHQQPPPHLAHLSSLPPHTMQRDHPANRLNNVRHHHPRGVDHQAAVAAAMAPPHLQMQVPPPPAPHQSQNARKPPPPSAGPGYYAPNGTIHGGLQKPPLPLTAAHMHPPPTLNVGPTPQQQQQQQHLPGQHPGVVVGGKLPYGMGQQQQQQHPGKQSVSHQHYPSVAMAPPIPVVSAATPAGTKTRHIPSNTDQKHHHHSHNTSQQAATTTTATNGNLGPGTKPTTEKPSKSSGGVIKHHHASTKEMAGTTTKVSSVPVATAPITVSANLPNAPVVSIIPGSVVNVVSDASASGTGTVTTGAGSNGGGTASAASSTAQPANAATTSGDDAMAQGSGGQQQGTGPATLSSSNSSETLANMKEKTTMCLVNELARYNKIQHQYRLTGETGPAHSKRFTVTLKLGDEEYTSEGASIKKAQHKAAGDAIAATKYKHPPARTNRRTKSGVKGNVGSFTPTVELNALAMKRGEPTVYKVVAVPSTVSKYALAGQPGTVPGGGASGGRRTMVGPGASATGIDKLPQTVPAGMLPPYGGSSLPPGAPGGGGRYGQPHSIDGGGGTPYWNRGPGVGGGRGGMGGFHPGNQPQQHHQQQQQQLHAHHPRGPAGLGIEEHHHHHHLHHHHPPPPPAHVNHHHLHHHQHDATGHAAGGYGGGGGDGVHHPSSAPLPAQELYKATLRVGERTFLGEGHTPQAARHDAAARALEVLKPLTASETGSDGKGKQGAGGSGGTAAGAGDGETAQNGHSGEGGDGDPNAELKSPISLVHEMAVQRQLSVVFEVISEKGPPHMTVFVTQCKVGTIVTEGEGTGKKLSKKRAAEKMLEQLRNLRKAEQQAALSNGGSDAWTEGKTGGGNEKRKSKSSAAAAASAADGSGGGAGVATLKKKARNLIKEKSVAEGGVSEKENPISRLMQIQQARKEKQPVYALVEGDRPTTGRRKQFTIEVTAAGKRAVGVGMTKKAAKWTAAEALLIELGYAPSRATGGPVNKENQSSAANEAPATSRKVLFNDPSDASAGGTPLKPVNGSNQGTVQNGRGDGARDLMNDSTASNDSMATNSSGVSSASSGGAGGQPQTVNSSVQSASSATSTPSKPDVGRNKEQLLYLAQLLKFEVQFSDFPKGNHGQYLTLVVLTTEPPQMCHGSGASLQESQDEAARCALEMLAKIGLDNVKPKTVSAAPDGAIAAGGASK